MKFSTTDITLLLSIQRIIQGSSIKYIKISNNHILYKERNGTITYLENKAIKETDNFKKRKLTMNEDLEDDREIRRRKKNYKNKIVNDDDSMEIDEIDFNNSNVNEDESNFRDVNEDENNVEDERNEGVNHSAETNEDENDEVDIKVEDERNEGVNHSAETNEDENDEVDIEVEDERNEGV